MSSIILTDEQNRAIDAVMEWFQNFDKTSKPYFTLMGFAGVGKTVLATAIAERVRKCSNKKIQYAAFTGKAAQVMRSKGCTGASTIHSMIYIPVVEDDGSVRFEIAPMSAHKGVGVFIIDECSMVGDDLALDLLSFGIPVLVLGDPEQLPPVEGTGYFTSDTPDFMLTQIHRQAQDNPIIAMSMVVRHHSDIPVGEYGGCRVVRKKDFDVAELMTTDQVLCGKNATRMDLNAIIRELYTHPANQVVVGDRLICLKNDKKKGLLNGTLWTVRKIEKEYADAISMRIQSVDDEKIMAKVYVSKGDFFANGRWSKSARDRFTFGYAITVHKSQGSQWNNLVLFDESGVFRDEKYRWLYTGITRAAEQITIVV